MKVKNGKNIFLQLEKVDKKFFHGVLRFTIEHSYEAVVICKVGQNLPLGRPIRDLERDFEKINSRSQNPKI